MMMDKKTEDFYARLKEELTISTLWPSEYLYKFIMPSDIHSIAKVEAAFNIKLQNNQAWLDGVLSRKKQVIPFLQPQF